MPHPPSGTVTFLFTDIEGSTRLWELHPAAMRAALARHDALLRGCIEAHRGFVFKTIGDAFCAAFETAPEAVAAAVDAQRAVAGEPWEGVPPLKVRMALHTGAAEERDGDYFGPPLNRVARLLATAHGGQVLLSLPTEELVRDTLPPGLRLLAMGEHRLKDLLRQETVFQVAAPDLPESFPPLKSLGARPNNLPVQLTPMVGRQEELTELSRMLRRDGLRLVTLTGPGGTGKTRLSLQAAAEALDDFSDGVYFVPLAAITEPPLVATAILQALGIAEQAGRAAPELLRELLKERDLLLVLDNFEQVLDAARLVGDLLTGCPKLRIVATSRVALTVPGEQVFPVAPLGLPPAKSRHPDPGQLERYAAVELYVRRAEAVRPGFALSRENAPAVVEICQRLDGLPLAIELAAARSRVLTPRETLDRLDHRLRLLTGGARNLPPRQQTLRNAIDWSYDLLGEEGRTLYRRLGVFAGGWDLEAAETVVPGPEEDMDPLDLLDGLAALVDHSLVRRHEEGDGSSRYSLLGSLREYAMEKLEEAGEAPALRDRHLRYYRELAAASVPELEGPDQKRWLDRLELELDNFRPALDWALQAPERADLAAGLAADLWWFWYVRGYWTEGRERLRVVHERTSALGATYHRCKLLHGFGVMGYLQGDYAAARDAYETVLPMWREVGDRRGESGTLNVLGVLHRDSGEPEMAIRYYEQALALRREIQDRNGIAGTLVNLALVRTDLGDYEAAWTLYQEALPLQRATGHRHSLAMMLNNMGQIAYYRGDSAAARACWEESLTLRRELVDDRGVAMSLVCLASLEQDEGRDGEATPLYLEALETVEAVGDRWLATFCHNGLGNIALTRRDFRAAYDHYRQAAEVRRDLKDRNGEMECLIRLAGFWFECGDAERAARLFGAVDAANEVTGYHQPPRVEAERQRHQASARAALGDEGFEAAWRAGRALTAEQAIELGLSGEPPPPSG